MINRLSKCFSALSTAVFLGIMSAFVHAAPMVDISSSSASISVGQSWDVFFDISGLSSTASDSLSGFDIDVAYDPALLFFQSASFIDLTTNTNQLELPESSSSPFIGGAIDQAGTIDAFGISGNSVAVLDADQASGFRFLTLRFTALQAAPQSVVSLLLGDPNLLFINSDGIAYSAVFLNATTSVAVTDPGNNIPTTSPLLLILWGVAIGAAVLSTARHSHLR
jgi:hypothetical protein